MTKTPHIQLRPTDIIIAVMGMTGVGKSTFIQHFTEQTVIVGKTLDSCTADVQIYTCSTTTIPTFYLVDTPGFDDTLRSDTVILREVASWLGKAYSSDLKLTGIIYLHRIQDVRLGGAGMKNLRMFKALCGEESLGSVVLATTFWGGVDAKTGLQREGELKSKTDFWGALIAKGSSVFRQDDGRVSAEKIIAFLVQRRHKVVLEIQKEMVDGNLALDQTAAGGEVDAEMRKVKAEYEKKLMEVRDDMKTALARQDRDWQEEIQRTKDEFEAKMRIDEEERQKLHVKQEELWRQREQEREEERREWLEEKLASQQQVTAYEKDLEMARVKNRHDLDMEKVRYQLQLEQARVRMWEEKEESSCVLM